MFRTEDNKSSISFFDNIRFDESAIIEPHINATSKRVQSTKEDILVIHDTTEFNYTHHKNTGGMGYLSKIPVREAGHEERYTQGFLMHASLAITTDGVPLGLLFQNSGLARQKT